MTTPSPTNFSNAVLVFNPINMNKTITGSQGPLQIPKGPCYSDFCRQEA
jgi:hypothetical protein